ncbi:MAG: M48 family metalloprotease [Desulfobacterales bacterium]|jgi:predicted Zn-dependent protease
MRVFRKLIGTWLTAILVIGHLTPQAVFGLTVKEEEEMARSFLGIIYKHYEIIEDPAIVNYVNKVGNRIVAHLKEPLFHYRFFVINTHTYNAFAIPAGYIFINSGLLMAMDNEEQLAGILGHEIAHVNARHISQKIERSKKIGWAGMAGMAAGVLMGLAGAGGGASQAVLKGSQAATQTAELSYSRENEMQADQLGLIYLNDAGYGGEGLLKILKAMRARQWYDATQVPTYLMTHPAIDERIAYIDGQLASAPKTSKPQAQESSDEFQRVLTHLMTQYGDENLVLRETEAAVKDNPADLLARHRYGLILARVGRREEAIDQLRMVLEKRAFDPYILRDIGRVYFLDGKYQQALKMLKTARNKIPNDAECGLFLGELQLELGAFDDASAVFLDIVKKNPTYTQVYYFLGQSLGKQGELADAHYYLAVFHSRKRDYQTAVIQLRRALKYAKDAEKRAKIEKALKQLEDSLSKAKKKSG